MRFFSAIVLFGYIVTTTVCSSDAWGAEPNATAAGQELGEARLAPLPKPPSLESQPPLPEDVEDLDSRLKRLYVADPEERQAGARELLELRPRAIAAALVRLNALAARGDRERMKRALSEAKERASHSKSQRDKGGGDSDLLLTLLAHPDPKDRAYGDVVELLALSRVLTQIGTVDAARALIEIYVRFGEFMRVDTQNRLSDLKDGAIAALIEARRHKAEKIAHWAERQLDRLGKAVPGEAVRTADYELLADILRAFGKTRDPDAAKLVVSYANNERFQIREASRQAIAMMGDVGLWQLREAYEDIVGTRARRDWSWERTARELFFEYDKLHVEKVIKLFESAKAAEREGKYEQMATAYDSILTRLPQFERGDEMAPGYYALAKQLRASRPLDAQLALVRVERLTKDARLRAQAKSLRDTLIAEERLEHGVLDVHLLQAASDRDPTNARAKTLLISPDRDLVDQQSRRLRWLTSGAIGTIALVSILWLLFRRPHRVDPASAPKAGHLTPPQGTASPREVPSRAIGGGAPRGETPGVNHGHDTSSAPANINEGVSLTGAVETGHASGMQTLEPTVPMPAVYPSTPNGVGVSEWSTDLSDSPSPAIKPPKDPFEGL